VENCDATEEIQTAKRITQQLSKELQIKHNQLAAHVGNIVIIVKRIFKLSASFRIICLQGGGLP
jgi:hypothetical protein